MAQFVDGLHLPFGYQAWADGLYQSGPAPKDLPAEEPSLDLVPSNQYRAACLERVASAALWISRAGDTVGHDPERWVELTAHDPRATLNRRSRWVRRDVPADARKLGGLAAYGYPVHSENARELVRYLSAQEAANATTLPQVRIARRVGYVDDPARPDVAGWLFGREWIGPAEVPTVLAPGAAGPYETGFSARGTLDGWRSMLRLISQRGGRIARWLVWASFAAPILRLVGERTFIVMHYGASSGGKSALAKFATSGCGAPTLKLSMNRTAKSFLGPFQHCTDLPIVFDEMQSITEDVRDQLGSIVYQITEEQQRSGMTADGTNRPLPDGFRAVVRFTGEQNLIGEGSGIADLGGQANRVLQFQATVLDPELASEVNKWVDRGEHYGHAMRRFLHGLAKVTSDPAALDTVRLIHLAAREAIEAAIGKQPRVGSLAAVVTAQVLGHRWILDTDRACPFTAEDLTGPDSTAFRWAVEDASAVVEAINADPAGRRSLTDQIVAFLRDHRLSAHDQYVETHVESGRERLRQMDWRTMAGLVRHDAAAKVTEIVYPGPVIDAALSAAGFAPARVWHDLRQAKVLWARPGDTRLKQVVRLPLVTGVGPQRCYVVRLPLLDTPSEADQS